MKILPSALNLRPWIERVQSWPRRQRQLLLVALGLLLLVLGYYGVVQPLLELEERWDQEVQRQQQLLLQYQGFLANKDKIKERYQKLQQALAQGEGQLLSGGSPAVAAAELQEIVKTATQDQGVQVLSTKVLPHREKGSYLEVPLALQLQVNMEQLVGLLHRLEFNKKIVVDNRGRDFSAAAGD